MAWCRAPSSSATCSRSTWSHSATSPASTPCTCSATSAPTRCRWRGWARSVTGSTSRRPRWRSRVILAARCGLEVRFVESELYGAVDALGREQFDLVYTGVGCARLVARHKGLGARRRRAVAVRAVVCTCARATRCSGRSTPNATTTCSWWAYPYFETEEPEVFEFAGTYTDGDASGVETVTHEWNHGLGEIVQAVLDAGLTLDPPRRARLRGVEGARLDGSRRRRPLAIARPPRAPAGDVHPRSRASPASFTLEATR